MHFLRDLQEVPVLRDVLNLKFRAMSQKVVFFEVPDGSIGFAFLKQTGRELPP